MRTEATSEDMGQVRKVGGNGGGEIYPQSRVAEACLNKREVLVGKFNYKCKRKLSHPASVP
jgi:hypothetical protein